MAEHITRINTPQKPNDDLIERTVGITKGVLGSKDLKALAEKINAELFRREKDQAISYTREEQMVFQDKIIAMLESGDVENIQPILRSIKKEIEQERWEGRLYFPDEKLHEWDDNPDFFKKEVIYLRENPAKRISLIRDIGLTFYVVRRGDTKFGIRRKLSRLKEFSYLSGPEYGLKLTGFNLKAKDLRAGMLIPIPVEAKERRLTDEQFSNYCQKAIEEMKTDQKYGKKIERLLKKVKEKELVTLMLAVAKQESGGKPLGQFEFHRWENHKRAFSFSIFHIVMRQAGFRARNKLEMTEGQTYHPKNAAKLFLAFLMEKARKNDAEFYLALRTKKEFERFAVFYNGRRWKKINPYYVKNLKKYLKQAQDLLKGAGSAPPTPPKQKQERVAKRLKQPEQKPSKAAKEKPVEVAKEKRKEKITGSEKTSDKKIFRNIGSTNLISAIRESNWENSGKMGRPSILVTDQNIHLLANKTLIYLRKKYPQSGTTYYPKDQIAVWKDRTGPYLVFSRNGKRAAIRLPVNLNRTQKKEIAKAKSKFRKVGRNGMKKAIIESNWENSKRYGENILGLNKNVIILSRRTVEYLRKMYRSGIYYPNDEIAVWKDKRDPYLIFKRGDQEGFIRLPN